MNVFLLILLLIVLSIILGTMLNWILVAMKGNDLVLVHKRMGVMEVFIGIMLLFVNTKTL